MNCWFKCFQRNWQHSVYRDSGNLEYAWISSNLSVGTKFKLKKLRNQCTAEKMAVFKIGSLVLGPFFFLGKENNTAKQQGKHYFGNQCVIPLLVIKDLSCHRFYVHESLFDMLGKIKNLKDRQDFLRSLTSGQYNANKFPSAINQVANSLYNIMLPCIKTFPHVFPQKLRLVKS